MSPIRARRTRLSSRYFNATGAWLADLPTTDVFEGAHGEVLLGVDLDVDESEIAGFELVEPGEVREQIYRVWIVPASFVNERGSVRIATEAEEQEGDAEFHRRAHRIFQRACPASA